MRCNIIKNFYFSRNGIHREDAISGETVDIPIDLIAGLEAEGFVNQVVGEPFIENKMDEENNEKGATVDFIDVHIPENVDDMEWPDMQALANSLTESFVRSRDQALSIIADELKRRQAVVDASANGGV